MKYFKQILFAAKKPMLFSLVAALLVGMGVFLTLHNDTPFYVPLGVALLAWLILWVLLFVMITASIKKDQPLTDILESRGYCEEWLQKHSEIYPTPDRQQKLRRVDVLSYLGRYDEAKDLLDSIPTIGMSDDRNFEYNNARLDMLLTTGHYDEAKQTLDDCRQFMDIYANANPLRGAVYGLNAGVILALADDFEGSEHYLNAAGHTITNAKGMSPALLNIAKTMQLYALGFSEKAEEKEEQTYHEILQDPLLTQQWQREHFLALLGRAQNLSPEKRQENAR